MLTGEQLRLLRQARKIMQKEMSHKMGISQQRLSALEASTLITDDQTNKALAVLKLTKPEVKNILKTLPSPPPAKYFIYSKKIIPATTTKPK